MSKKVAGVFTSESETIKAINRLTHEDYTIDEMLIIADKNKKTSLIEAQTDVKVEKEVQAQQEESSFWKKLKSGFSQKEGSKGAVDYASRFKDLGLTSEEAEKHEEDVKQQKIVLLTSDRAVSPSDHNNSFKTPTPG